MLVAPKPTSPKLIHQPCELWEGCDQLFLSKSREVLVGDLFRSRRKTRPMQKLNSSLPSDKISRTILGFIPLAIDDRTTPRLR